MQWEPLYIDEEYHLYIGAFCFYINFYLYAFPG